MVRKNDGVNKLRFVDSSVLYSSILLGEGSIGLWH